MLYESHDWAVCEIDECEPWCLDARSRPPTTPDSDHSADDYIDNSITISFLSKCGTTTR